MIFLARLCGRFLKIKGNFLWRKEHDRANQGLRVFYGGEEGAVLAKETIRSGTVFQSIVWGSGG